MALGLCGDFYTFGARNPVASHNPTRGKPLRAEYEEVHSRPITGEVIRRHGVIYRDRQGRVREEDVLEDGAEKPGIQNAVVTIWDPDRLVARVFDSRTGQRAELDLGEILLRKDGGPVPRSCAAPSGRRAESQSEPSRELLGTRAIEGFPCHGIRIAIGEEESEDWLCGELEMLLLQVTKCPDFQTIYRVFNIKLEEPDPNLFGVPGASP